MPQFSTAPSGAGLSPRTIQSMVAFGIIGLVFVYLGLASLGIVQDPFDRLPLITGVAFVVAGVFTVAVNRATSVAIEKSRPRERVVARPLGARGNARRTEQLQPSHDQLR